MVNEEIGQVNPAYMGGGCSGGLCRAYYFKISYYLW